MPHPVEVNKTPFMVNEEITARAEELVRALVQVIHSGAYGSFVHTPPTTVPGPDGRDIPLDLSSAEQQLFYRQIAIAIAAVLPTWLPGDTGGAPGPTPVEGWGLVEASCPEEIADGDVVFGAGSPIMVGRADPFDATKMPAVGVVERKLSSTTCEVRVGGPLRNVYSDLEVGRPYFVGEDGRPTPVAPNPPTGSQMFSQSIGVALDANTLLVTPNQQLFLVKR